MENEYPVKTYGVSYVCDGCNKAALEYKEIKCDKEGDAPTYKFMHVCPNCGEEYLLDKQYPYTKFIPITFEDENKKRKWWNPFKGE